jgi:hypothetical protein
MTDQPTSAADIAGPILRPSKHSRETRPTKSSITKRAKRIKVTLAPIPSASATPPVREK